MLMPIEDFCRQMLKDDPSITPAEMLHNLHAAGYDRQEAVLAVKEFFPDVAVDEMCRIIVNEYVSPLIEKGELHRLLILCKYDETEVNEAIERYYPRSLGYIMMLDDSASMYAASAMIKIDAKAFLDSSRTGDQFGVNEFEVNAAWVYPEGSDPVPATVTESRGELDAAKTAIDRLTTVGNLTNIGAAVGLGNGMFEKLITDIKAFVLISDGAYNTGPNPADVLKNEPPVYIAGLGPYMRESYFKTMLAKNTKSKFYNSPDANGMMKIFNQILADSSDSLLVLDNQETYSGSYYSINEFFISGQGNRSLLTVVWSDKKYQYTPVYPGKNLINLVLVNPGGDSTSLRPCIAEAGFCIYDLRNLRPGKWKLLAQYSVEEPVLATAGVIQAEAPVGVEITGQQFSKIGETPDFLLRITGNRAALKNVTVSVVYGRPAVCVKKLIDGLMEKSGHALESEEGRGLLLNNRALFSRIHTLGTLLENEAGVYRGTMGPVDNTGIYSADLVIRGEYADTGIPFVCHKKHAFIVE